MNSIQKTTELNNNYSLSQALKIMKGFGNQKREANLSIHGITKEVYQYTMKFAKNCKKDLELDQIDDFLQTPQATRQILLALKQNLKLIFDDQGSYQATEKNAHDCKDSSSQDTSESNLLIQIRQQESKIKKLENKLQENDKNFKSLQLKLLNNIKKLNQQIMQKDLQLNELRQILSEKEEQLESLTKVNDKKYRKIRQLQEDIYDLEVQLQKKDENTFVQDICSRMTQNQLTNLLVNSQIGQQIKESKNKSAGFSEVARSHQPITIQNIPQLTLGVQTKNSEMGIQTDGTQALDETELSIRSESRESHYLESIQKLTSELSEAYQRINELTKTDRNPRQSKCTKKIKTSSTYFSKDK